LEAYGFIKPTDGSADVFLHATSLPDDAATPEAGMLPRMQE
jgi:cold shock CspA family protein